MQTYTRQVTVFDPTPAVTRLSVVNRIMLISEQENWGARILREFGPITEQVEFDGMLYCDISKWDEHVPGVAYRRHNIVTNQLNPNILQVLIGDEIDNDEGHLTMPEWDLERPKRMVKEKLDQGREKLEGAGKTMRNVGKVALPVAGILLAIPLAMSLFFLAVPFFIAAVGMEPNYVIVVEEEDDRTYWVELVFWYS